LGLIGPGADTPTRRSVELGQGTSADGDELQSRLLQAVQRYADIEVIFQRAGDQLVQDRVAQAAPPLPQVGTGAAGARLLAGWRIAEAGRNGRVRREIFRTDGTTGQGNGQHQRAQTNPALHTADPGPMKSTHFRQRGAGHIRVLYYCTGFWTDALLASSEFAFTFTPAAIWLERLRATFSPTASPVPIETMLPSSLAMVTSLKATAPEGSTTATCGPPERYNMAAAGIWIWAPPVSSNSACTYMPGTSERSEFGTSISMRMVRDCGLMARAVRATWPSRRMAGMSALVIPAPVPAFMSRCATLCGA